MTGIKMRIKCQLTQRYWMGIHFSEESQVALGGLVSISPKHQMATPGTQTENAVPDPRLITVIDTDSI